MRRRRNRVVRWLTFRIFLGTLLFLIFFGRSLDLGVGLGLWSGAVTSFVRLGFLAGRDNLDLAERLVRDDELDRW